MEGILRAISGPRVEVLLDEVELTSVVEDALIQLGGSATILEFAKTRRRRPSRPADARIVLTSDAETITNGKLSRLLECFDRDPCTTLVLSPAPVDGESARRAVAGRAIAFASGLSGEDLVSRLIAMCGLHEPMEQLQRQIDEFKQREAALVHSLRSLEEQVETACRLQRDLIASPLPDLTGIKMEVLFKPADLISGDLYHVARLDESHIGISLADAVGHGLPAAFLSTFAKQLLATGEWGEETGAIHGPSEVLARLNGAVLDSKLPECQFLAALNAVYDERSRSMRWARGGIPYPMLIRRGEAPRPVRSNGPVVGVLPDATFEVVEVELGPGDRLIFHTDGLAALLDGRNTRQSCFDLSGRQWFQNLRNKTLSEQMRELKRNLEETSPDAWDADDITVIAIEATASSNPG